MNVKKKKEQKCPMGRKPSFFTETMRATQHTMYKSITDVIQDLSQLLRDYERVQKDDGRLLMIHINKKCGC